MKALSTLISICRHRGTGPSWLWSSVFLLLGGCSGQERVVIPQSILDDQTVAVLWADIRSLEPESLEQSSLVVTGSVPEELQETLKPLLTDVQTTVAKYREFQLAFTRGGGYGMLVLVSPPRKSTLNPHCMMLARVGPQFEKKPITEALRQLFEPYLQVRELVPFDENWLLVKADELRRPDGGTADVASNISKLLDGAGKGPIKIAFRMTDLFKGLLQAGPDNPEPAAFFHPLMPARSASLPIEFGSKPALRFRSRFKDEMVAHEFDRFYQSLLVMAQGITLARLKRMPNATNDVE